MKSYLGPAPILVFLGVTSFGCEPVSVAPHAASNRSPKESSRQSQADEEAVLSAYLTDASLSLQAQPGERDGTQGSLPSAGSPERASQVTAVAEPETYHLHGFAGRRRGLDVPSNAAVSRYVNRFTSRAGGRATVSAWLERTRQYGPMIEGVLDEYGLPKELLAVALIESGLNPQAVSPAGATGMWQFVGDTAVSYGLQILDGLDERRIPELATDAAARHLRDLHDSFGDWPLALAAYNAGESRIRSLCESAGTADYWVLRAGDYGLPEETAEYVPKVLAMVTILRGLSTFGFEVQGESIEDSVKVSLPPGASLSRLTSALALSQARFAQLNPGAVGETTSDLPGGQRVRVPKDRERLAQRILPDIADPEEGRSLLGQLAALGQENQFRDALRDCVWCGANSGSAEESWSTLIGVLRSDQRMYRVQAGDSLGRLAKRFGVTEESLREENNVEDPRAIQVGTLLIVPSG